MSPFPHPRAAPPPSPRDPGRLRVFRLLLTALGLGACGPSSPGTNATIPSEPEYIRGAITAVEGSSIRVEENSKESSGSAKAVLRITPSTAVLWRSGEPAEPRDLRLGTRVRVWVSGPVQQSYPTQATASIIVIDLIASQVAPQA